MEINNKTNLVGFNVGVLGDCIVDTTTGTKTPVTPTGHVMINGQKTIIKGDTYPAHLTHTAGKMEDGSLLYFEGIDGICYTGCKAECGCILQGTGFMTVSI